MTVFNITVYYDTTCAWCIIGHRVFGQAVEAYQRTYPGGRDDQFEYDYRPFYLRPHAPVVGIPLEDAMIEKNGAELTKTIKTRVSRIAKSHGVDLSYNSKTGNTRKSHQLIWQTGQVYGSQVQAELVSNLLSMHFEHDGDITSEDDLAAEARKAGVDEGDAREWMRDETLGQKVDDLAAQARLDGVSSVPTYIINGTKLEGAEDLAAFYEAFIAAKT